MISFKKYLTQEKEDVTSWLIRIVILLLEASALHAVEYDPEEYAVFRRQMRETIDKFEQTTESRDTLIIAGEAVKLVQMYNQSVERFIKNLNAERQGIIGAMTESILKLVNTSETAGQTLRKIGKELSAACQLQDVRLLKSKLKDCLERICEEAGLHEERASKLKTPAGHALLALSPKDQVTGLPGLRNAEARIKEIAEGEGLGYVVALFVKNLDSVNRRIGFAAGDEILALIGQKAGRFLLPEDQLFRWRGPCFVALIERSENHDHVLAEAAKIASFRVEKEIESEGRNLFFKASIAWALIPIHDGSDSGEVSRKIDIFAAGQNQPVANAH
jgi:GGDEF domain-containing protein